MRFILTQNIIDSIIASMESFMIKPLSKEDRIKFFLDSINYQSLSYWQRKTLLNEIKENIELKEKIQNSIIEDVIETIGKIFKMPVRAITLISTTQQNTPLILLQNIYGNNSAEKPNNY